MKCKICDNEDNDLFANNICLKCYEYLKNENVNKDNYIISKIKGNYNLIDKQKIISDKILNIIDNEDVLVNAVTGAGKTEIIYPVIERMVNDGKVVGFAAPRKDLIIELDQRIRDTFPKCHTLTLYGGHTVITKASLYIFTTHQVSRFENFFDCLILDEVDAFPYYKNEVLERLVKRSVKGHIIYMSATISKMDNVRTLTLNRRFHGCDIPIPTIKRIIFRKSSLKKWIKYLLNKGRVVLVFVSSIKIGSKVCSILSPYNAIFIHSKLPNRDKLFKEIREYKYNVIITTTIMERGITLKNVSVIVYDSESTIFDVSTLLQIVGRVGRKVGYEDGEIYFFSTRKENKLNTVIKKVRCLNESV